MTVAGVSASTVQPACLMVMGSGAGVEPPRLPPTCVRAYVANIVCYMFACELRRSRSRGVGAPLLHPKPLVCAAVNCGV